MLSVMHIIRLMGLAICDNEIKAVLENKFDHNTKSVSVGSGRFMGCAFFRDFSAAMWYDSMQCPVGRSSESIREFLSGGYKEKL